VMFLDVYVEESLRESRRNC